MTGKRFGFKDIGEIAAISYSMQQRHADPKYKAKHKAVIQSCWDTGKLAKRRVVWTPEKDALLIKLFAEHKFRWLRKEGLAVLGVSDLKLMERIRYLQLSKKRL